MLSVWQSMEATLRTRIWGSHSGGYEEYCLLGYNAVWSVESQPMLKQVASSFHAGFLLGLFLDPEDGGDMFLRNVGWLSSDYTALCPRR
jgi:hypothetical protein